MIIEREKVIAALEWCIEKPCNPKCPYFTQEDKTQAYCLFKKIMPDALALLKEQEARVMMREEVVDLLQGSVVWYEEKSESGTYLRAMISAGNGFLGDFYLGVNAHEVELKRQRFWTSRPSEQQMRDTPWEETENG